MLQINDTVRVRHEINLLGETYINRFNGVIKDANADSYYIDYGGSMGIWVKKNECKKPRVRKK